MAKKTDKQKRSRIQYKCPDTLQALFNLINAFPQIENWVDFYLPIESAPLFPPNWRNPSDFDKKAIEKIKKFGEIGIELFNYLKEMNALAKMYVIKESEFIHLKTLQQKLFNAQANAQANARDVLLKTGKYFSTMRNNDDWRNYKNEIDRKIVEMQDCEKEFCEAKFNLTRIWFERYENRKQLKKLLTRLTFIARNYDSANKELHIFEFVGLDGLLSKIYVDDNGILRKKDDIILQTLIGLNITRIRQCAICRNFFWANRIDRQCCAKKCADVHNKRNSRNKK